MIPIWGPETSLPKLIADLKILFQKGQTFKDNINCAFVTLDCKHNTETLVANPLRMTPVAFIPISSVAITTIGGQSSQTARPIGGVPVLNTSRTDGYLGLTVKFAPPAGEIIVTRTTTLAVGSASATAVVFSAVDRSAGDVSWTSGSQVTLLSPGVVETSYLVPWSSVAGGTVRDAFVRKNGAGVQYAETFMGPGQFAGLCGVDEFEVATNDYLQLMAYQDSGGSLNIQAASNRCMLRVRYVAPLTSTLGRVTGILVGA